MKCRVFLDEKWQIKAVCQGCKPFSLFEVFMNHYNSNYKKRFEQIKALLHRTSMSGPESVVRVQKKYIVGTDGLYEFRVGDLRVFYASYISPNRVVLFNAYVKDNTKRDREIKKAIRLKQQYEQAIIDKELELEWSRKGEGK